MQRQIQRLEGMRDFTGQAYETMNSAIEKLTGHMGYRGYVAISTPMLEETELFVRKSGGELTSRLYTFTDPGGRTVSLRPEFTSSVIRHLIEEQGSLPTPVRLQYNGPVFRYEPGRNRGYQQFTQVGAELVGLAGIAADAEIIDMASSGLEQVGLRGHELRIGHFGVHQALLASYGLSEPAKSFITSNIDTLKNGPAGVAEVKERAAERNVLRTGLDVAARASLEGMDGDSARELLQGFLSQSMSSPSGRRTTDQIVSRLLRKLKDSDDPALFEDAMSLVSQLARLQGAPGALLADARSIVSGRPAVLDVLDDLEGLLELLSKQGLAGDRLVLDLSHVRGISYYTGVIFDLGFSHSDTRVSLGGGGRYDGLVRALGSDSDVPALGFAYNLDQVVDTLSSPDESAPRESADS